MKKIISILIIVVSIILLCGCTSISGNLSFNENAYDDLINVEVNSPILIREVQMYQRTVDEAGEECYVLANYIIDETNNEYSFDNRLTSKVFYRDVYINDHKLTEQEIYSLAYSQQVEKIQVVDLGNDNGNQFNLVLFNNSYVTASNQWQVGDIKITFYYIDPNNIYSIK